MVIKKKPKKKSSPKLSVLKKKAWSMFSERLRKAYSDGSGMSRCYTCGKIAHWKELQCGHGIPGRHGAVLFDEDICRPQCMPCNVLKHGMLHVFATNIIADRGKDWWDEKLQKSRETVKFSRSDLEALIDRLKTPPQE